MLHIDLPSRAEIEALVSERHPACVSIYLATSPLTPEARADRTTLRNLVREAVGRLRAAETPKRDIWPIEEAIDELSEDEGFWTHQAHSLAIFASPERMRSFRLPNRIESNVEVADRFHVKPLLRAIAFPQTAFVLALAEGGVRFVEVAAEGRSEEIHVPNLPKSLNDALGERGFFGRSPDKRTAEPEGENVRLRQFSRAVDRALRPVLRGEERALILAAAEPMASIYPKEQSYKHFEAEVIGGNVEHISAAEIADRAREILDRRHAREIADLKTLFEERRGERRATSDLAEAARAATFGAIETLLVDMDASLPGRVAEDGAVSLAGEASAANYGVLDEIAGRAFATGARVFAAREGDIPGDTGLAAILRYPV
jgi:Bacterial archaeo-eukaryotic release factor family 11